MKRVLNIRVAIVALALLLGVAGYVMTLPQVNAMFTPGVCTYYSNGTYRTAVGARGTGCCGEPISWGVVTAFRKCEKMYCLDIWCPPPSE